MQEQRVKTPAWREKSNQELMVLCDKGWTALSRSPGEKKRFEDMKAEHKSRDPEAKEKEDVLMPPLPSLCHHHLWLKVRKIVKLLKSYWS